MKNLLPLFLLFSSLCSAQSFEEEIYQFRNKYVAEHLEEAHSPIKYQEVQYLDFYAPAKKYQVEAKVEFIKDEEGFEMLTHTGIKRRYFKYAKLSFRIQGKKQHLYLYQSERLMKKEEYKDYLFLPFTDATNYKETFGGGRYIDFVQEDIQDGKLLLDFNRCYNPYCAYAGGYSCPIPPKENRLDVAIQAGEKLYLKKQAENQH